MEIIMSTCNSTRGLPPLTFRTIDIRNRRARVFREFDQARANGLSVERCYSRASLFSGERVSYVRRLIINRKALMAAPISTTTLEVSHV
jgi:hypothetical protein